MPTLIVLNDDLEMVHHHHHHPHHHRRNSLPLQTLHQILLHNTTCCIFRVSLSLSLLSFPYHISRSLARNHHLL